MSTLHTRGYRPKPGERWNGEVITVRRAWAVCWRNARMFGPSTRLTIARCAGACLAARERHDPLVSHHGRRLWPGFTWTATLAGTIEPLTFTHTIDIES